MSDKKVNFPAKLFCLETIVACGVLGLVVIAWTLYSILNPGIDSTDRTVVGTAVLKDMQPHLLARDTLFANDQIYRYYTPLYRWIVAQIWQWGGSFEVGFIWLLPLVMGGYLAGMYLLLRRVTGNSWIALGLTVAAAHYHNVMGASGWGVGSSASLGARTLFMPVAPILTLLLLQLLERPSWLAGAIFGLLLGLAANLHPISGFHFLALASVFLVLNYIHNYRGWQMLLTIGLGAGIGGLPVGWHFFSTAGKLVGIGVTFEQFSQVVTELYAMPFSPRVFTWPLFRLELTRPALDVLIWLYLSITLLFLGIYLWGRWQPVSPDWIKRGWLVVGLIVVAYAQLIVLFESTFIFMIVALYIIYRFWRGSFTRLDYWLITLMGLIVLYAFVGYYLFTFVWQKFELWAVTSFLTEFARSAAFVYLPVYLLVGLAGVAWTTELAQADFGRETAWAMTIGVVFAFAPSAVMHLANSLPLIALTLGLIFLLGVIVFFLLRSLPWSAYLGGAVFMLILFGPPAPLVAAYFPVPVVNLLEPTALTRQPLYASIEAELYNWVGKNTSRDALFYGCFGPITMTHFRFRTQRSISHNWKDLTFNLHNRATLVPAYERFRRLEAACADFDNLLSAAHALKADYLLVSSQEAANFLGEACFVNKKYALFTLHPEGCVVN